MSLLPTLPTVVENSLKAINNRDSDTFIASFTPNAIVVDEGKTYAGQQAISAWNHEALISHNASITMSKQASDNGSNIAVPVIMDGDFVADYAITEPFPLFCEFTLEEKEGLIREPSITGWDPSVPTMMSVWANRGNEKDPLSSIRISRRPILEPPENRVKVRMHAVGLNYHDIFTPRA